MSEILQKPIFSIVLLLALCCYLFFFQLGGLALTDPDETFYAETAKEMLIRGEWITPYLFDKPQFEKPILFYWLVEISFKVFGVNEFAARFPSALFGLIGVIAMYLLGRLVFSKMAGFLSAIILATNIEYIVLARGCLTDMVLFALVLLGLMFSFYGYVKGRRYFYFLSSAAFGLAVLTKGPIAIMLPMMAFFTYIILSKDWKLTRKIPWIACLAIFILVAAPWYAVVYKLYGREFINTFFGFQNLTRFFESEHKMGSQFYYNIPVVFAGFFPWSVFLPFGVWRMFKQLHGKLRKRIIFILSWFAVIFLFFTASSTKLPTYIFPCWISLALVVGTLWDEFLSGTQAPPRLFRGVRISYFILILAVLAAAIGALIFIKFDYPDMMGGAVVTALSLISGFMLSVIAFFKKRFSSTFFLIAFAVILFLYPVGKFVVPQISLHESCKGISQRLTAYMKPVERLGAESHYRAGLAFYTGKMPINLDIHDTLVNFLDSEDRIWFVLKEKNHIQIYTLDTAPFCKKPSYAVYQFGKKVIATNKIPEDGKYLIKRQRAQP